MSDKLDELRQLLEDPVSALQGRHLIQWAVNEIERLKWDYGAAVSTLETRDEEIESLQAEIADHARAMQLAYEDRERLQAEIERQDKVIARLGDSNEEFTPSPDTFEIYKWADWYEQELDARIKYALENRHEGVDR